MGRRRRRRNREEEEEQEGEEEGTMWWRRMWWKKMRRRRGGKKRGRRIRRKKKRSRTNRNKSRQKKVGWWDRQRLHHSLSNPGSNFHTTRKNPIEYMQGVTRPYRCRLRQIDIYIVAWRKSIRWIGTFDSKLKVNFRPRFRQDREKPD